jgi:flotillin
MAFLSWLIPAGIIILFLALLSLLLAKQYRKVGPNEALIISGGRKRTLVKDGVRRKIGYRYRLGGGTLVLPFIESVDVLPMDVLPLNIRTPEVLTHGGVPILAEARPRSNSIRPRRPSTWPPNSSSASGATASATWP